MRQSSFQKIISISLKSRICQLHHLSGMKHHSIIYESSCSQKKTILYIRQLKKNYNWLFKSRLHKFGNNKWIVWNCRITEITSVYWVIWTMVIYLLNLWHIWVHSRLKLCLHLHSCWEGNYTCHEYHRSHKTAHQLVLNHSSM